MNWNFQPGIHPDADQLSVFVEGAATAREEEKVLVHLAECVVCRKAVFLMQPHEEMRRPAPAPAKGFFWWRLLPVGLPAAALACGLIAVLVYLRPHGVAPRTPQQIASIRQPDAERPAATAAPSGNLRQGAPVANADRAASVESEQVARSGAPRNGLPAKAATNVSPQENQRANGLNLLTSKGDEVNANIAPQKAWVPPSTIGGPVAGAARVSGGINTATVSDLPLNGRNFTNLQQLQPADTNAAASQNSLARKKDLPALEIQRADGKAATPAGLSGRITDRSGAIIAGATITMRDAAGKTRQTTTGADGSFHVKELPPGQYELTATATGFRPSRQSIELKPSELAMLQPVLDIGAASETVEVQASSPAVSIQTESANITSPVVAGMPSTGRVIAVPSGLPATATVSHGKLLLSLDGAGNLFLSRNEGKKWKKIKPRWAGKPIRIELTPAYMNEAPRKPENEISGPASTPPVFVLTTDANAVWTSKDGAHWHQQ